MATVLLLDDERSSSARLCAALHDGRHQAWTAETLSGGMQIVEELGSDLDLLVLDTSMFNLAALGFLDFVVGASPLASVLLLSPSKEHRQDGDYRVLRKPFSDREFLDAVDEAIASNPLPRRDAKPPRGQVPGEHPSARTRRMPAHKHHNGRARFLAGNWRSRGRRHDGPPQAGIG